MRTYYAFRRFQIYKECLIYFNFHLIKAKYKVVYTRGEIGMCPCHGVMWTTQGSKIVLVHWRHLCENGIWERAWKEKHGIMAVVVEGDGSGSCVYSLFSKFFITIMDSDRKTKWRFKSSYLGNPLVVQWIGLGAFTAIAQIQSLVRELRSHTHSSSQKLKLNTQSS